MAPPIRVLVVADRNTRNVEVLDRFLARAGYRVVQADSRERLEGCLSDPSGVVAVLLDVASFGPSGRDLCALLRGRGVPFFLVTQASHPDLQARALALGARGALVKPLSPGALRSLLDVYSGP